MESNLNSNPPSFAKKAVFSLVFGILSVVLHHIIGLVLGILAVVFGNDYLRLAQNNGLTVDKRATVGRILGIIGIVFSACSVVWSLIKFGGFLTALFTSISSGSLGIFEEYFQGLGESLRGGMISAFHFLFH